jgi:hypothetical protein
LIDFSQERPSIFGKNPGAFVRGEQAELKRATLPPKFQVAAEQDKPGPRKANVTCDLLGAEQHAPTALHRRFP